MPSPDSIGPLSRGPVQFASSDWASVDIDMHAELGGLARMFYVPVGATGGTLVFVDGEGNECTLDVDPEDGPIWAQIAKIKQASTVTAVWVGR